MKRKTYDVILADPPWSYSDRGASGSMKPSGAAVHYNTLTNEQICQLSVGMYAKPNSLLFLWVTAPQLPVGMRTLRSWGFEFKTIAFTWVKTGRTEQSRLEAGRIMRSLGAPPMWATNHSRAIDDAGLLMPKFAMGQGSYTRANPEFVLLGKRGKGVPRIDKGIRSELLAPRGRHSAKPPEIHERIEALLTPDVDRLEMFCRQKRPGWDAWGNEIDSDVDIHVPR